MDWGRVRCARGADCFFAVDGVAGLIRPGQLWDRAIATTIRAAIQGRSIVVVTVALPRIGRSGRRHA